MVTNQGEERLTLCLRIGGGRRAKQFCFARRGIASQRGKANAARLDAPRGSKYEWVNRTLFISTAERQADLVIVHFYRVL